MQFSFTGDIARLEAGIDELSGQLGISRSETGMPVRAVRHEADELIVRLSDAGAVIAYRKPVHFFRGLGLLLEAVRDGAADTEIRELPQFSMNGPMFDVSQGNAVMRAETVKRFLRMMALMGLDMIMLYAEDSYEIDGQPFFGYMRGRYTQGEIRELDRYALQFGIEMIPCIQTLSHLEDVLKWKSFDPIRDDEETLLVGDEATYAFIEQMIVAASAPVTSKRIHIGMDEAWKLGLGRYLARNGYRSKFELMNEHLERVLAITRKHGLEPMMWSDMYFRAGSKRGSYYDVESVIPPEVIAGMPKDVQFVYWDYYHYDEGFYAEWIRRHKAFGSTPVFAGGIWNWKGFALNYGATFAATESALRVCKREGVREVIATLWGDDGTECDWFSSLLGLQLFAEHGYAAEPSEEKLRKRFASCTGCSYDDFVAIKWIDEIPGMKAGNLDNFNPSRCLLWQNPLMGLFDRNIADVHLGDHYNGLAARMAAARERQPAHGGVFELLHRLCDVLALKAELGLRIKEAYLANDRSSLQALAAETIPELSERVKRLYAFHRERWMAINKPFGWEVIEFRYGGLLLNLDTAVKRIADWLNGDVDRIEELEEPRLYFHDKEGPPESYWYKFIPSASRLLQYQP
ncbi:beta-N-acetylhexosaminidase [Paenibacillus silvisoli]|uniref:beta-N-acetylhexosaminidase n=1 Tax=Paenibacillus silvisoli TaxID=3110539 RepID=UPI00280541F2|nr:beta-N-acetylhexosaminidase [Paenibacillus silvisoli]